MKKKSLSNEILAGLVILATFVSLGSSLAIYNIIDLIIIGVITFNFIFDKVLKFWCNKRIIF